MKTLADVSDDARRGGPGHAVITVDARGLEFALKTLKKQLAASGTVTALKRARIADASGRAKFKEAGARRRRARAEQRRAWRQTAHDRAMFREG